MYKELSILKCNQSFTLFTANFVYKQQPALFHNFYKHNSDVIFVTTRQSDNIFITKYKTTIGQKTDKYKGGKIWNSLPLFMRQAPNYFMFTRKCIKCINHLVLLYNVKSDYVKSNTYKKLKFIFG